MSQEYQFWVYYSFSERTSLKLDASCVPSCCLSSLHLAQSKASILLSAWVRLLSEASCLSRPIYSGFLVFSTFAAACILPKVFLRKVCIKLKVTQPLPMTELHWHIYRIFAQGGSAKYTASSSISAVASVVDSLRAHTQRSCSSGDVRMCRKLSTS